MLSHFYYTSEPVKLNVASGGGVNVAVLVWITFSLKTIIVRTFQPLHTTDKDCLIIYACFQV